MAYFLEVRAKGNSAIPTLPGQKPLLPEEWKRTENTFMDKNQGEGYETLGELLNAINNRPDDLKHGTSPEKIEYRIVQEEVDREVME